MTPRKRKSQRVQLSGLALSFYTLARLAVGLGLGGPTQSATLLTDERICARIRPEILVTSEVRFGFPTSAHQGRFKRPVTEFSLCLIIPLNIRAD